MSDGLGVCILPKSTAIYMLERQPFPLPRQQLPATARPRSSLQASTATRPPQPQPSLLWAQQD